MDKIRYVRDRDKYFDFFKLLPKLDLSLQLKVINERKERGF